MRPGYTTGEPLGVSGERTLGKRGLPGCPVVSPALLEGHTEANNGREVPGSVVADVLPAAGSCVVAGCRLRGGCTGAGRSTSPSGSRWWQSRGAGRCGRPREELRHLKIVSLS